MTLIADGGLTTAEIKGMGIPLGDAKKLYAEVQQLVQTRGGGAPSASMPRFGAPKPQACQARVLRAAGSPKFVRHQTR